jgi:hypothetical protein
MKKLSMANRGARLLALSGMMALAVAEVSAQAIPHIQRYSVFKNGQAFVYSIDSTRVENGKSRLSLPNDVLFGTLWIGSNTGTITSINSVEGTLGTTHKLETLRELLTYNIGKRVRITMAYQDMPEEATISSVLNNAAVFKLKDRWITTTIDKIETIEFLDEPTMSAADKGQALELQWDAKTTGHQLISTVYMRNKLGWVPEYFVILENDNKATISLRAKLINDAEDIKDADINFVAGVPNFRYNITDPLASKDDFTNLMWSFGSNDRDRIGTDIPYNMFSNQQTGRYKVDIQTAPDGATMFAEGEASEDFYYYTLKNITLNKGGRASYPILDGSVNMKHVYKATLPANGMQYIPLRQAGGNTEDRITTVYHSIELTNSTGQPWTSGSAFVVTDDGGQTEPLAQDLMPYTSAGGKAEVQITSSPEVRVTDKEEEKDRKEDAKEVDKVSYDEITVEGIINVQNNKEETVTLDINRSITGTLVRSDLPWVTTKDVKVYNALNPQNQVSWNMVLKSGEKKTVTYRYKILVPKQ